MGINRIRLQDGATGDPRVDARMQQTYQQNIAANQDEKTISLYNEIMQSKETSSSIKERIKKIHEFQYYK